MLNKRFFAAMMVALFALVINPNPRTSFAQVPDVTEVPSEQAATDPVEVKPAEGWTPNDGEPTFFIRNIDSLPVTVFDGDEKVVYLPGCEDLSIEVPAFSQCPMAQVRKPNDQYRGTYWKLSDHGKLLEISAESDAMDDGVELWLGLRTFRRNEMYSSTEEALAMLNDIIGRDPDDPASNPDRIDDQPKNE